MNRSLGTLKRALSAANPISRLRSIEERVGLTAFTLMLLFVMTHGLMAHEFKAGSIEIGHPWSRAAPAGAKVAGGFLVLKNEGGAADRLVSVSSDIAGKAEIHEMSVENGVMKMRALPDGIEVPAGGTTELKPGSYHLMFMDLKRLPKEGESFQATLTFEKAGPVTVDFTVEAMGGAPAGSHDMNGMKHGG